MRSFFREDREEKVMHPATCDKCGKRCEVPFKPRGDKPIYCSDCFEVVEQRGGRDDRGGRGGRFERNDRFGGRDRGDRYERNDRFGGRDRDEKRMYPAICDDCGKNCDVPFKPSSDKPIYCSACFEKRGNQHDDAAPRSNGGGTSVNLAEVNAKLDKILSLLEPKAVKKEVPEKTEKAIKKDIEEINKSLKAPKKTTKKVAKKKKEEA